MANEAANSLYYANDVVDRTIPPSNFTLFRKLPEEIRTLIWEYACFLPRNLDVFVRSLGWMTFDRDLHHPNYRVFRYTTTTAPPAILHSSQEARSIGLKYFTLGFGMRWFTIGNEPAAAAFDLSLESPARIYFNPGSDTICRMGNIAELSCEDFFTRVPGIEMGRSIALNLWGRPPINSECHPSLKNILRIPYSYDEILLYYTYEALPRISGPIEFTDFDVQTEDQSSVLVLEVGCRYLHRKVEEYEDFRKNELKLEIPQSQRERLESWTSPNIRLVSIVVNGVKL